MSGKEFLERIRKVYGQTEFIKAYEMAMDNYSIWLNNKDFIRNESFKNTVDREINKTIRYAHSLSY